jgi:hypothetical protein
VVSSGLRIRIPVLNASTEQDLDGAFASLGKNGAMAHRDASLRRTDWVAIEGIADMPGASRTSGCDATDPQAT